MLKTQDVHRKKRQYGCVTCVHLHSRAQSWVNQHHRVSNPGRATGNWLNRCPKPALSALFLPSPTTACDLHHRGDWGSQEQSVHGAISRAVSPPLGEQVLHTAASTPASMPAVSSAGSGRGSPDGLAGSALT
ncbi:hypothetical protein Y1Q_0019547 [Alligator mississippiensis]|uniref:Uncharacterized protein n=1 Tax=Alligator mississippiensis TaxID=8496 RepID=A0A151M3T6_ALLMI|nr:hypothetical protein Y1Q_0019547 [Alligator mississippiensis]